MPGPELTGARLTAAEQARAVRIYQEIHQHPELGFAETRTARRVARELARLGCRVRTGVGGTGVIGVLGRHGRAVALRADMDALPITEASGLAFASRRPGQMHACGHDLHIAIVLGAARILARQPGPGTYVFIFQPSEEGPKSGARAMIADGALVRPRVHTIFGLHVDPTIPTGKVGFRTGPLMARSDDFDLVIHGRAGHAATPHTAIDAVAVAAQVTSALQLVISRGGDPVVPAVLTIGEVRGGFKRNVIADRVELGGTIRSLSDRQARTMIRAVGRVARRVARALGARAELHWGKTYPALDNDRAPTDLARQACRDLFGARAVHELRDPIMGAEDFACYLRRVPGAFLRLGIRNPRVGAVHPWHSPRFRVDVRALAVGAPLLALCARRAAAGR